MFTNISYSSLIMLVIFWLGLAGVPADGEWLLFGVVAIGLSYLISDRMSLLFHSRFKWSVVGYCIWLAKEIILSSITVSKLAWQRKIVIRPVIDEVRTMQETNIGTVIYANSITLTPGTVSIDLTATDSILVHALDIQFMDDLKAGQMDRNVKNIIAE